MTIAVIWQEDSLLWCAADTRIVVDPNNRVATEIAAKIYVIPVAVAALDADGNPREPHYRAQYGFVYAGSVAPATMTAITSSTFLQKLVRSGSQVSQPTFEQLAEFVCRLSKRFMAERREHGADGKFSAGFFGWCPHTKKYKVAHIDGRDEGSFRVELSYPEVPEEEGDTWLILGDGAGKFRSLLADPNVEWPAKRVARHVIDKMVSEEQDPTVGGATSIAFAHENRLEFCATTEMNIDARDHASRKSSSRDQKRMPIRRPMFNGLDLETEVGSVGEYEVGFITIVI